MIGASPWRTFLETLLLLMHACVSPLGLNVIEPLSYPQYSTLEKL